MRFQAANLCAHIMRKVCVNALRTMRRYDRRSQSSDKHAKCVPARSLIKRFIISCLPIFFKLQLHVFCHNVRYSFTFPAQKNSVTSILPRIRQPCIDAAAFLEFLHYILKHYLYDAINSLETLSTNILHKTQRF